MANGANVSGHRQASQRDAVAISGTAFRFIAAVASALVIGVSGALWVAITDGIRLAERVEYLYAFGPGTGQRFTQREAAELKERITLLEKGSREHDAVANELIGRWKQTFSEHERRIYQIERNCEECRRELRGK